MADMPMAELIAQASSSAVLVRSPQAHDLATALANSGAIVARTESDALEVTGLTAAQIGERARELNVSLHELSFKQASLEEAFMEMTRDEVEYHAKTPTGPSSRSTR